MLSPKSLFTSDNSGLNLFLSEIRFISPPITSAIKFAVSLIEISNLLAAFITFPFVLFDNATAKKAAQVSSTKLKSLVGLKEPNLISFSPWAICVIIVGITALELCLGP